MFNQEKRNYESDHQEYVQVTDPEHIKQLQSQKIVVETEQSEKKLKNTSLPIIIKNKKEKTKPMLIYESKEESRREQKYEEKERGKKNKVEYKSKYEPKEQKAIKYRPKQESESPSQSKNKLKYAPKYQQPIRVSRDLSIEDLIKEIDEKLTKNKKAIIEAVDIDIQTAFSCAHELHKKYPQLERINKPGLKECEDYKYKNKTINKPMVVILLNLDHLDNKDMGYQSSENFIEKKEEIKPLVYEHRRNRAPRRVYRREESDSDDSREYR